MNRGREASTSKGSHQRHQSERDSTSEVLRSRVEDFVDKCQEEICRHPSASPFNLKPQIGSRRHHTVVVTSPSTSSMRGGSWFFFFCFWKEAVGWRPLPRSARSHVWCSCRDHAEEHEVSIPVGVATFPERERDLSDDAKKEKPRARLEGFECPRG